MKTSIKRQTVACALLAVALWLVADPAMAQESILAPVGEQFFAWIQTFETDLFPPAVTGGLLLAVAIAVFVSIKLGIFAFAGVVAAALLWGTRETIIGFGA